MLEQADQQARHRAGKIEIAVHLYLCCCPGFQQTCVRRLTGKSDGEQAEIERVKAAGGWVEDERVCDILAVSRAFGDADFKEPGLQRLAKKGVECALAES